MDKENNINGMSIEEAPNNTVNFTTPPDLIITNKVKRICLLPTCHKMHHQDDGYCSISHKIYHKILNKRERENENI